MSHQIDLKRLTQFNGFYNRPDAGDLMYALYEGICQATNQKIDRASAHIGHIVPQASADLFEKLYPGLDVHNAINLHLISAQVNCRNSAYFIPSPAAIHHTICDTARRIHFLLSKLTQPKPAKAASRCKPKIYLKEAATAILMRHRGHLNRAVSKGCGNTGKIGQSALFSVFHFVAELDLDYEGALDEHPHYAEWARGNEYLPDNRTNYRTKLSWCRDIATGITRPEELPAFLFPAPLE